MGSKAGKSQLRSKDVLHNPDFSKIKAVLLMAKSCVMLSYSLHAFAILRQLLTSLEAEGPKYFAEDAQTCPWTASNRQAARVGGAKPGRESAAAQVDMQREIANGPSQSHGHTFINPWKEKVKAEIVSVPMEGSQ